MLLSDRVASQLFGNINPVGKVIIADDSLQVTVAGVLQPLPANSSIKGDVFLTTSFLKHALPFFSDAADWYNRFALNYLRLRSDADVSLLDKKIAGIVETHYDKKAGPANIIAVPFSNFKNENGELTQTIIKGSIATACFILLIVIFNLINLNTASMYTRAKEVAVRKVIGGSKLQIFCQFCIENGIVFFLALIAASLLFVNILTPQLNKIYKTEFIELAFNIHDTPIIALFIFVSLVAIVLAGSTPGIKLIDIPVTNGVKGQFLNSVKSKSSLRNIFIVLQFTLAVAFICITIILNRQINHMQRASLGFDKVNTVVVNLDMGFKGGAKDSMHFATLLSNLRNNPNIQSLTTSQAIPTRYENTWETYIDPATSKEVHMRYSTMSAGYTKTYSIPLIKGRDFDDELSATEGKSVIINKKAMDALAWKDINGKQLVSKGSGNAVNVVGVMDDFHYQNMQYGIEPLLHTYAKPDLYYSNLTLKVDPQHTNQVLSQIETAFKEMGARRPFKYNFMNDLVDSQYDFLNGILRITNFVAFLTIIISCMGMFALTTLYAKQRVKEIGIRKVLGAKTGSIVIMLSRNFVSFVLVACAIAAPLSLWIMNSWLQRFSYRIEIKWWMFVSASIIAITIAIITVGIQTVKAALANPVKSLRSE